MMLHDLDSLTRSLRSHLILATSLDGRYVRNSLSTFGSSLDARQSQNVFSSICNDNDAMLLFELKMRASDSDSSMTEADDVISYFKGMQLKVILYGKQSSWLALCLIANFRSDSFRSSLAKDGIYLESVSEPETINEFVNDVMWNRADLDIDFSCHFAITSKLSSEKFETENTTKVLETI